MYLKTRAAVFVTLIAFLLLAWSAPGEAQGRRPGGGGGGGGGRSGGGPATGGGRPSGGGGTPRVVGGGGRVVRGGVGRSVVVVRGGYYFADPFWYGYPWYGYSWFGYGYPGYGYGYPGFGYQYPIGGYPYPYYSRFAQPDASVRLEVTPREAEVFIDGYYAGIVDDFDGVFQRLRVPPGDHELILYQDGYRTVHQNLYLNLDSTFRVRYTMEKLQAGDVAEPRPIPKEPPATVEGGPGAPQPPPAGPRRGPIGPRPPQPPLPPNPPNPPGPRGPESSAYGTLAIRVQPGNASVLIDNDRWEGPQGQERLLVELSEGRHRVQIQREGFETFATDITIRRGETTPLNVSLRTR